MVKHQMSLTLEPENLTCWCLCEDAVILYACTHKLGIHSAEECLAEAVSAFKVDIIL